MSIYILEIGVRMGPLWDPVRRASVSYRPTKTVRLEAAAPKNERVLLARAETNCGYHAIHPSHAIRKQARMRIRACEPNDRLGIIRSLGIRATVNLTQLLNDTVGIFTPRAPKLPSRQSSVGADNSSHSKVSEFLRGVYCICCPC